ncbi:MFS transporter [soil metagenome]
MLITAMLGTMLAPLNSTMIVVALPEMLHEFGRSFAWGTWIVISYLVAMAAVQPLGGSLGDRYGRRRIFLAGLSLFLVATVVAALAWRIEVLIVARIVQAIGGASAIPNGTALVRSLVPPARQGRAFGKIGAGIAVAAALGPPVGGVLTDTLGWRWIFAANILLISPALVLGLRLPADRILSGTGRFDLRGAALLTSGLVTLAFSLTAWRLSGVPLAVAPLLLAFAIGAGVFLSRHVQRHPRPVLNLTLFRRPGYLPATLTVLLSNMTMYTVLLSLPVFLTGRNNWSSSSVGFLLAGMSFQMILFSPVGGWLSDRSGRRLPAVIGTSLIAAGTLPLLVIRPDWSWPFYLVPLVLLGIGVGLSAASVQTAAIEVAPSDQTGQAAGLFSTMRYLGSITGSAGMAAILSSVTPSIGSFRLLYALLLLAACGALVSAGRLPRRLTSGDAVEAGSVPLPIKQA